MIGSDHRPVLGFMTRALVIASFVLCFSAPAPGGQARGRGVDTGKALVRIMREEGRWARAVVRRDVKALGRILAEDYMGTDADGEVHDKAQTLAELRSARVGLKSFTQDGFDVRFDGDAATVTGRATVTVLVDGEAVSIRFNYARDYSRRKNRWLVTRSIMTSVDE